MPTNRKLMAMDPSSPAAETRRLVMKWGRLHAARTVLGLAATLLFLWASLS